MKNILILLAALFMTACGGNDFELVEICPNITAAIPAGMKNRVAYARGCPADTVEEFPDLDIYEVIPWGITRVGAPLLRTNRTVWILDTGIDIDHPELNIDLSRSISFVPDQDFADHYGHGTHVAGTVAAKLNGFGVVGVAPGNTIVAVKVLSNFGWGQWEWVAEGIDYVVENGEPGDVVNLSLGGRKTEASQVAHDAVLRAADKGILFSIAAGNNGTDVVDYDPASVEHANVLTVSAIDKNDCRASFSNHGETVEFAAPGVNVLSTFKYGRYKIWQGTSMAAPHVTGLLLYGFPNESGPAIVCDINNKPGDEYVEPIAHF